MQLYHSKILPSEGIHGMVAWVWANAAARQAQTASAEDIYKVGYQQDTGVFWVCIDDSPDTFVPITPEYSEVNVSNPPTNAQMLAAFPDAAAGTAVLINDAGLGTNAYYTWFDGTKWYGVATTALA